MKGSIDDSFKELIALRGWYKSTHADRKLAAFHKKLFLQSKLIDEIKRKYLLDAGYTLVQIEMWEK